MVKEHLLEILDNFGCFVQLSEGFCKIEFKINWMLNGFIKESFHNPSEIGFLDPFCQKMFVLSVTQVQSSHPPGSWKSLCTSSMNDP